MSESFVLLVNPRAGHGRAARLLDRVRTKLEAYGCRFETQTTERPGHATELARAALRAGAPGVAVIGGDGTLNEAINGFFDASGAPVTSPERWLGPLPCGTGGDFRKTLAIGDDVDEMVRRFALTEPTRVDVGWASFAMPKGGTQSRAFINIASFGISGHVTRIVNASSKRLGGPLTFAIGTLRARARYRNARIRIRADGGPPRETRVLTMAIANGRYFGGGMMIAPEARLDDGAFDVVSLERPTLVGQLAMTPALYSGDVLLQRGVGFVRARRVDVESLDATPVLIELDGEPIGQLPATFEVRPRAVSLR